MDGLVSFVTAPCVHTRKVYVCEVLNMMETDSGFFVLQLAIGHWQTLSCTTSSTALARTRVRAPR